MPISEKVLDQIFSGAGPFATGLGIGIVFICFLIKSLRKKEKAYDNLVREMSAVLALNDEHIKTNTETLEAIAKVIKEAVTQLQIKNAVKAALEERDK